MRIMMLVASALAYFINGAIAKGKYGNADKMNFEHPLTSLVWITSIVSDYCDLYRFASHYPRFGRRYNAMVEAGFDHLLRNVGGSGHS
jgi:hypothetical protein